MKKRFLMPAIYSILIFLSIFSFHTYQNLKAIVTPPSEKWAREIYIDKTPYKKPSSINMDEDNILILTAKEDRLTKSILDKNNNIIKEVQNISIPDAALNKLVKYKNVEPYLFWTENYELYMSKRQDDNNYEAKKLILEEVMDFYVFSDNEDIVLAVAYEKGLKYYRIDGNGISPWGEEYPFEKPAYVSVAVYDNETYHTVSIRDISPMEKEIVYLIFSDGQWIPRAQKKEYAQVSNESIGNLEIGIDKDFAYIFYENNVWNSFGQSARTLYAVVPLDESGGQEMSFKAFSSKGAGNSTATYVSEVRCPDYRQDQLTAVFIEEYYGEEGEGFKILNVVMDNGEVANSISSTRSFDWIKGIDIAESEGCEALTFLTSAGEFKYDVWFTQTGEEFKNAMEKPTKDDCIIAMQNSISPYVSGLVIALIRAFIFLPSLFWLLVIEFFEIKRFLLKPRQNYHVAVGIYMILKLISANFYYKGLSYYMMPDIIKLDAVKYLIMIATGGISYLVAKSYKKCKPDLHIIPEFLLFMLYDLLTTVFLYGPYIT